MPARTPAPYNRNNAKQTPIPVISRAMPIVNPDGTITRSGQLLLEKLQPPTTTYGDHPDRPDPGSAPDGSVYIEIDRGSIYQNLNGVWRFITGTMWATLNPDQRPTDLGVNDGGFDFRTTDAPAREFIWSQTAWVEATPVRYGTHAARLAEVTAQVIDQLLWVENDRGAIYQLQGSFWQYIAGTMWGTMSPDQRPTDLGTHDAGFEFRSTDAPPREFIWSQTAWVETTSISGSTGLTHANVVTKVGSAGQIVEGGITDASAANSGHLQITVSGNIGIQTPAAFTPLGVKSPNASPVTADASSTAGISLTGAAANTRLQFGLGGSAAGYGSWIQSSYDNGGGSNGPEQLFLQPLGGQIGIGTLSGVTFQFQLGTDSAGKPATSTWTVVSDIRLKQNIEPVKDDSLAVLSKLDWIRFEYDGQANTPRGEKAIGLVAQELQAHLPEAVRSTKTKLNETDAEATEVLAIDYHHILVHSARAIQQLDAEIKALRAMIGKP